MMIVCHCLPSVLLTLREFTAGVVAKRDPKIGDPARLPAQVAGRWVLIK
jgi:hypothetical protein